MKAIIEHLAMFWMFYLTGGLVLSFIYMYFFVKTKDEDKERYNNIFKKEFNKHDAF